MRIPPGRFREGGGPVNRRACHANALHSAIARKWVCVEGVAIPQPGSLAALHAWVTPDNSGVAYDPTWHAGREYFGIPFRLDYVLRMCEKTKHPGLLDVWELGWPLLCSDDRIGAPKLKRWCHRERSMWSRRRSFFFRDHQLLTLGSRSLLSAGIIRRPSLTVGVEDQSMKQIGDGSGL